MKDFVGSIVGNKLVMAIVGIVFGAMLIVMQREALDGLVYIMGAVLLVAAAVYVALYALGKQKRPSYVVSAIVAGVAGFVFVVRPDIIVNFFPMLVGFALIISGLIDLFQVLAVLRSEGRSWGTPAVMSAVVIAAGAFMLFFPGALVNLMVLIMGISLLVNGLFDLYLMLVSRGVIKQRDVRRAHEREQREQQQREREREEAENARAAEAEYNLPGGAGEHAYGEGVSFDGAAGGPIDVEPVDAESLGTGFVDDYSDSEFEVNRFDSRR